MGFSITFTEGQIEILPGIHTYNFQTVLPANLPTSFEAKSGFIRYTVRVALERPWKFDLTYKMGFTILKQHDLNYETPTLRIPTKQEESKAYLCGFCRTNSIYLSSQLDITGFVPGQAAKVIVEINNPTSFEVEDVKVSLKKFISYKSQTPKYHQKTDENTEQEIHCGKIAPNFSTRFTQNLFIPPVPPSSSTGICRVLNVSYEVQAIAQVSLEFSEGSPQEKTNFLNFRCLSYLIIWK